MERGVDRIAAEELTVPPGGDELFSLLVLKNHAESERLGRDRRRLRADRRDAAAALVPRRRALVAGQGARPRAVDAVGGAPARADVPRRPAPDEKVVAEVQRLVGNLVAMHELLRDASRVSMRLVMTPDRMVVAEAMRTFTYLNLYGYLTDAVVVNRVFPDELAEGYFGAWHAVQQEQLDARRLRVRPGPGAAGAVLRRRGDRRRAARRLGRGAVRARTTPPPCCTTGSRRSCAWTTAAPSCGSTSRSPPRAT